MSRNMKRFVPVPQESMGIVIGKKGIYINEIKQKTHTKITPCNGDQLGRKSGFTVFGSEDNIEAACKEIQNRVMSAPITISELIPQQYVGLLIGGGGNDSFRRIQRECDVKIIWPTFSGTEKHVSFDIKGARVNCDRALEMLRTNMEKWKKNKVSHKTESPAASGSRNDSKVCSEYAVSAEYVGFIVGRLHKNVQNIEKKSRTMIKVPRQDPEAQTEINPREVIFNIIGKEDDIVRAKSLIKSQIISLKGRMKADKYGGNEQFVCLDFSDENKEFKLEKSYSDPKLNGFLRGARYRIKTEKGEDAESDDVGDNTLFELKDHLMTSLKKLHDLKDEKELMIDLWCHFGKVFVHNVDENEVEKTFTPEDICNKIQKIVSPTKNVDKKAYWKVSFEEGVHVDDNTFPEVENSDTYLNLKPVHTQRRYDFGFTTPSARNVRLKAWNGLPPGSDEPPVEVKNILRQVSLQDDENIKAWICYPSTTVLKGEIMTPNSKYDCRMKLRAGSRYVIDKNSVCEEEDLILADYLSNCKIESIDAETSSPANDKNIPKGFECTFYRRSREQIYSARDGEKDFTVIVLDEEGWDSDSSTKREQKQFGIRVMMNSWSEALLYPERNWQPEEILDNLKDYMEFLSALKSLFI